MRQGDWAVQCIRGNMQACLRQGTIEAEVEAENVKQEEAWSDQEGEDREMDEKMNNAGCAALLHLASTSPIDS